MSELPTDPPDERHVEQETLALLADPEALRDIDEAQDEIARGEAVRGVVAVRALRPRR